MLREIQPPGIPRSCLWLRRGLTPLPANTKTQERYRNTPKLLDMVSRETSDTSCTQVVGRVPIVRFLTQRIHRRCGGPIRICRCRRPCSRPTFYVTQETLVPADRVQGISPFGQSMNPRPQSPRYSHIVCTPTCPRESAAKDEGGVSREASTPSFTLTGNTTPFHIVQCRHLLDKGAEHGSWTWLGLRVFKIRETACTS